MEEYMNCCSRKETAEIAWWRVGMWKLRGIRKGFEKGRVSLCCGLEDAKYILLIWTEIKKWREEFLCKTWTGLDQDLTFKKLVGCKNAVKLKNIGKYLLRVKGKWENKIKKKVQ
jgi:hypothetical protein